MSDLHHDDHSPPTTGWWLALGAISLVAAWLRSCNLGTYSLWSDEVFTLTVAALPLNETLSACAADAENVPLYAVVANIGLRLGADETWLRLAPIAAGMASIVLLALWTRRHFDPPAALLTAAFCALSPFHIRYSQELRAYSYLLLACTLTLMAADRLRRSPDWRSTIFLAAAVAMGFYTHLTYVLVLLPVAGSMVLSTGPVSDYPRFPLRIWSRFLAGVFLGVLAFGPWIWLISENLVRRMPQARTTDWTWWYVGSRWQVLTVAAREFERLSWFGILLAGFAVVGLAVSFRSRAGRAILLPALVTLVAWEVLLVVIRHWTAGRYDTTLWPFVAILVALGFLWVLRQLRWRWLQWAASVAVATMFLVHVDSYQRIGRPHWDLLARAVDEVRRPGETVVTGDHWARTCLSYYLKEEIGTIADQRDRLTARLEESPSVLLASRKPACGELLNAARFRAEIAHVQRTARLYRLQGGPDDLGKRIAAASEGLPDSWPGPFIELVPAYFEESPVGCLGRLRDGSEKPAPEGVRRLDFDAGARRFLRYGWLRPVTTVEGLTVAWVREREAGVDLPRPVASEARLTVRLRPHPELADTQRMRLLLNGDEIGKVSLKRGENEIPIVVPAEVWRRGRNLLVLQFSHLCCTTPYPDPGVPIDRPLAAAVDWIEVAPIIKAPIAPDFSG